MASKIAIRSTQGIVPFQIDFPASVNREEKGSLHVFPATVYQVSEAEWAHICKSTYKERFVKLEVPQKKAHKPSPFTTHDFQALAPEKIDHETESHKKKK